MGLCLVTASAVVFALAGPDFTLAWTHTIEKTPWEEDWRIEGGALLLREARISATGAGMEPPPEAVLDHGRYRWRPSLPPQTQLTLARQPGIADFRLCADGQCRPLSDWLGEPDETRRVTLRPCDPDSGTPRKAAP